MDASTNGYLTREQFLQLSTYEIELDGLGRVRFRKIGRAEYEALWPLAPAEAETWPAIGGDTPEALAASRRARRQAEADWLRTLPDEEQVRIRSRANDVAFRVIAACCKAPVFSVEDARALGDWADALFLAILTKSGLYEEPTPAPPPATAVAEPAPIVAQ